VSASVNLPLHHKVQKFLFWHRLTRVVPEKGCKRVVVVVVCYMGWYTCASCHQQGHVGCKSLLQRNPAVVNLGCELTQVAGKTLCVLYERQQLVVDATCK